MALSIMETDAVIGVLLLKYTAPASGQREWNSLNFDGISAF